VNILISPLGRACLADFGLASIKDSQVLNMSSGSNSRAAGTLRWQAPEILDSTSVHADSDGGNTLTSDIYALACVYYEVKAARYPSDEMWPLKT
jgi:serine/threonine protein kinase